MHITNQPAFLQNPTPEQLYRAIAANHSQWLVRGATAQGGVTGEEDGVVWAYTPVNGGAVSIPFPRFQNGQGGELLDRVLLAARQLQPLAKEPTASCWSLDAPPRPPELGAMLAARGFSWGWQPHWMWLDLATMRREQRALENLEIVLLEDAGAVAEDGNLYAAGDIALYREVFQRERPRRIWHFTALLDGTPVGHSVLHLTRGTLGVAGIFDVHVVPEVRRMGIGSAVTLAACVLAAQMGCGAAVLNATQMGEPMYTRLGFVSLGYGQTWWLHRKALARSRATPLQIALADAIGRGDLPALTNLGSVVTPRILDRPLPNRMSLLELAVKTQQAAAAAWLAERGARVDVLSAWDLGWTDRLPQLLEAAPQLANRRAGDLRVTPLHVAVERGDLTLLRILLTAEPDLSITDSEFHGTPLDWARYFQRGEMIELLARHEQQRTLDALPTGEPR